MKKLKIGVLLLVSCLFLTACGCTKEDFKVTFDSNGGTTVKSQTVEKGGKVTEPADPTRDGYTFAGWYLDLEDDEEYDFSKEVTKNITLIAKWAESTSGVNQEPVCNLTCEDGYQLVNGDSEDCKCEKINVSVTSVKLSKTSVSLTVGGTTTVTATVNPSNAADKTVTWKSSNEKVATVKDGKITAVSEGTATITATAGGKSSTVKVTVISKDRANLNAALGTIVAKTVSTGNTDINFSYNGCTITNTANTVSSGNSSKTTVSGGVVNTLYRASGAGSISSTYTVTCGSVSDTKTVQHTIPASSYTYTSTYTGILYILNVSNATDYTLASSSVANLKYLASVGGAQTAVHTPGTTYQMTLNSDASTIYAVTSAE